MTLTTNWRRSEIGSCRKNESFLTLHTDNLMRKVKSGYYSANNVKELSDEIGG